MKYSNNDIEEIYNSFLLDDLTNYPELASYKRIFNAILDRVFFFDELTARKNKNKKIYSCTYIRELIHICNRIPKDKLCFIDEKVFWSIDFSNAPYDITSLNYLRSILIPKNMIEKDYKKFILYFNHYFVDNYNRLVINHRIDEVPSYNNMDALIAVIYNVYGDSMIVERYNDVLKFFFSYFYINSYDVNKIREILEKINKDFGYYYDLVNMNINRDVNLDVYYFIENLLNEKDSNKKLIK